MKTEQRKPNRLASALSPYLRQHAFNPVDWYPWGEEAIAFARQTDRPIFLSVGYAACHWCHVMERESFENGAIARLLNESFVSIKVDREERPDLDDRYMQVVFLLTGQGGWPMSVFLTPTLAPFLGGTYFPPEQFASMLGRITEVWRGGRRQIDAMAREVFGALEVKRGGARWAGSLGEAADRAVGQLLQQADPERGGSRGAPKFPEAPKLAFLLDRWEANRSDDIERHLRLTLDRMALGGIRDHLGGGFHRYSTDADWLVPHFEKMLYDQAQLVSVYARAFELFGSPLYAETARSTIEFVMRELCAPEGCFYSSLDADTEGEEGKFYVWTRQELDERLGVRAARLFAQRYGVTSSGNFEGASVLHCAVELDDVAASFGLPTVELTRQLDDAKAVLLEHRSRRSLPALDDKAITSWNALMIAALADAYRAFGEPSYLDVAERAAKFLLDQMLVGSTLMRIYRDGVVATEAFLEDYAYLALALARLEQVSPSRLWADRAETIARLMVDKYFDTESGAFNLYPADAASFGERMSGGDHATPSPNGVAAIALTEMSRHGADSDWPELARRTVHAFGSQTDQYPAALPTILRAVAKLTDDANSLRSSFHRVRAELVPNRVDTRPLELAQCALRFAIDDGWHIQPAQADGDLTATEVNARIPDGWRIALNAPKPVAIVGDAFASPITGYTGVVEMPVLLKVGEERGTTVVPIDVSFQACSHNACLAPSTVHLSLVVVVE